MFSEFYQGTSQTISNISGIKLIQCLKNPILVIQWLGQVLTRCNPFLFFAER